MTRLGAFLLGAFIVIAAALLALGFSKVCRAAHEEQRFRAQQDAPRASVSLHRPAPLQVSKAPGSFSRKAVKTMDCSVYSLRYAGRRTASGKRYDPLELTCASNRHPLGAVLFISYVRVDPKGRMRTSNIRVVVTDRLARRYSHRVDLSHTAWNHITNGAPPSIARSCSVAWLQ